MRSFLATPSRLVSAEIVRVEVLRALKRTDVPAAAADEAWTYLATLRLLRIDSRVLARAAKVGPDDLRTLDALHLATALEFSSAQMLFLCYDLRLAAAARYHGLTVVSPGLDEVHEP